MWSIIGGLATKVLGPLFNIIDKSVTDKDLAQELKARLNSEFMAHAAQELESKRDVLVTEISGQSWLQRNWRPLVMLMFASIIANNYILVPYATTIGVPIQYIEVPVDLWELIKIGLGGYIVGRSAEKIAPMLLKPKQ